MKKDEYPIVSIPDWIAVDEQQISDGDVTYSVPSVIFQARDLIPFKLPLAALKINYSISTGQVRDFVKHMRAVNKADLTLPIILDPEGWVIDGRHRIAKALYEEKQYILAVRFTDYPNYQSKDENK